MKLRDLIKTNNIEEIKKELKEDTNLNINAKPVIGERILLHIAALNGRADIVTMLLDEYGANVDIEDYGKDVERRWHREKNELFGTPLFNMLDICAKKYAKEDSDAEEGSDIEEYSDAGKDSDIEEGNSSSQKEDYIRTAEILIAHGAKVDTYYTNSHYYYAAIHAATRAGFSSVVEKIIDRDPSLVNVREHLDEITNCPLEIAINNQDYMTIMILLKNGANVYDKDIMSSLEALVDNQEILIEAKTGKEKIENFLEAVRYVYNKKKLPNDWDINKFSTFFYKLNSADRDMWDEKGLVNNDLADIEDDITEEMVIFINSFITKYEQGNSLQLEDIAASSLPQLEISEAETSAINYSPVPLVNEEISLACKVVFQDNVESLGESSNVDL